MPPSKVCMLNPRGDVRHLGRGLGEEDGALGAEISVLVKGRCQVRVKTCQPWERGIIKPESASALVWTYPASRTSNPDVYHFLSQ